jgi:hypothetical protein
MTEETITMMRNIQLLITISNKNILKNLTRKFFVRNRFCSVCLYASTEQSIVQLETKYEVKYPLRTESYIKNYYYSFFSPLLFLLGFFFSLFSHHSSFSCHNIASPRFRHSSSNPPPYFLHFPLSDLYSN